MMTEDSVDKAEAWDALAEKNTIIASLTAERDALRARVERLEGALKAGVELIKGDAVGKDWKAGCADFLRAARDTMEASDG